MKVVVVDGDVSYPPTSGKRLRTLNLLLRAARRHAITYVGRCAHGSEEARTAPEFLRDHGIEPVLIHDPVPKKSGFSFYARLAANLLSSQPYSAVSHRSSAMQVAVREVARRKDVDIWQVEWSPYLHMIDRDISGKRLLVAHNVETLIWKRYFECAASLPEKVFFHEQFRKFERFEREAFTKADRVIAVSEDDARLISASFGQASVDVVENGVDAAYFLNGPEQYDRNTILFLGALDWRPNVDAVNLLLDNIFPAVRAQETQARLQVVGRNPSWKLIQRARSLSGVELHANVADVRPFLRGAGAMAVPLRIAGGSRLKILEALASGLPVVSTPIGAEGLRLAPGVDYFSAELDEMAQTLLHVMRAPTGARAVARHGCEVVLKHYDWEILSRKLEASWQRCVGHR
jgi:glycosyltransferase involved in cell wall biosynthesis